MKQKRVLAISSGGGHWVQLQRLKPVFDQYDTAYVTIKSDARLYAPDSRFYTITDFTRRNLWRLTLLIPQLVRILIIERPDLVITTGSAPGLACLGLARLFTRARTVWIDSLANREDLSTSGKLARRVAHVWLTQWPEVSAPDGPDYWGAVL